MFQSLLFENKRVLVIGLGGGCDCIVAYAFAKEILGPLTKESTTLVYGNTMGPRSLPGHRKIKECIFAVPEIPVPIIKGDKYHATSKIDCSLPRGPEGSPLIFIIKEDSGDPREVFDRNKSAILSDLNEMHFDYIFGIDTGGDSLTGGIDWKDHPSLGRDRQMLAILSWINPPTQFWHIMIAPCSDGESSYELMTNYLEKSKQDGYLLGTFSCVPMLDRMRGLILNLEPFRTPTLMIRAFDGELKKDPVHEGRIILPRGINPIVPQEWLVTGYIIQWPRNIYPDFNLHHL